MMDEKAFHLHKEVVPLSNCVKELQFATQSHHTLLLYGPMDQLYKAALCVSQYP